jgi:hypothetical protein
MGSPLMDFAAQPSHRPQHNFLAKIGLLWYEINDFSNAKKPTALGTVPRPKLISKDKASGILLPNAPSGIGESLFLLFSRN